MHLLHAHILWLKNSQDLSQGVFGENKSQEKSHHLQKIPKSWDKILSLATLL